MALRFGGYAARVAGAERLAVVPPGLVGAGGRPGWVACGDHGATPGLAASLLYLYRAKVPVAVGGGRVATKIAVALEDDLDGGPAEETVRFAVGGTQYEIDLNKVNARAFRKQLAPFIAHARRGWPGAAPPARAYRSRP